MLTLNIPDLEVFDEETYEFHTYKGGVLKLEHSLISISKWEANWHIPFLDENNEKTPEQTLDYIKCMTLNNVDPEIYFGINNTHIQKVNEYIENPMSATTFSNRNGEGGSSGGRKQIITSELIYSWMVGFRIPPEYQKWHINRLLNLIHICEIQNKPPSKLSKNKITSRNAALNAQRRAMMGSKG